MPRALVIGSLNMDLLATVARHPRVGETIPAGGLRYLPGGKGSNQAVACRRLGASVDMVGYVGEDAFGEQLREFQAAEGIGVGHVRTVPGQPSGMAFVNVAEDGSNTIVVVAGANHAWAPDALSAVDLEGGDVLLTQLEIPTWVVEAALSRCRDAGAIGVLNPSPVDRLDRRLLALADVVVLNEHELWVAAGLGGEPGDFAAAEWLLSGLGCRAIVTTLGAGGCRVWTKGTVTCVDGIAVDAVDTTGAGDCFAGALAAGLLEGRNLADAASMANAAAAVSVTRAGAAPSMPRRRELAELT